MLGKVCWKPGGMGLGVTSFFSCGFVKFCIRFSHKSTRFMHVKRIRARIPFLNRFAVSCAVFLQRSLTITKVCLLLPFLLKKVHWTPVLHFSQNHLYSWVNTRISLELGICQCVQICEVFRVILTLFDGDYFWHTKHDASRCGIILLYT